MIYNYTAEVAVDRLTHEISTHEEISVALDYINVNGSSVDIVFKSALANIEKVTLDNMISSHVPEPLDDASLTENTFKVQFQNNTSKDNVPYVYQTTRPLGQYLTYFTGEGDTIDYAAPQNNKRGGGGNLTFCMCPEDDTKSREITFYEDVWVKDGFIICKDAPFGAAIDISVVHPVYGPMDYFGIGIPVAGTGWFPLDTEDRAFIPGGLRVRITVRNSVVDGDADMEPRPEKWFLSGRLELFRSKLTPT